MAKFKNNARKSEINNKTTIEEASTNNEGSVSDVDHTPNEEILKEIENNMKEDTYRNERQTSVVIDNDNEGADAKVFSESKEKKRKNKKVKKPHQSTTWAHKMRVLGVLLVLGIFTGSGLGVWYFNFELRTTFNPFDYNAADYMQSVNYTLEKNDINATEKDGLNWVNIAKNKGLTPADLTPADNFILAEYNVRLASSYIVSGKGYVDASLAVQDITSIKKYNGEYYTFESISPSAISLIDDIILCDKYDGKKVSLYTSTKLKPTKEDWKFSENVTPDEYNVIAGALPNAVTAYIVSEKTVLNNTQDIITVNEDGTYTLEMKLDNKTSIINYSKQIKRTGGLGSYPQFNYINFTATIDSDWNLLSFTITEEYKAVKGLSVTCKGRLNYTVTVNCDVDMSV